jgi:hypothetical protein
VDVAGRTDILAFDTLTQKSCTTLSTCPDKIRSPTDLQVSSDGTFLVFCNGSEAADGHWVGLIDIAAMLSEKSKWSDSTMRPHFPCAAPAAGGGGGGGCWAMGTRKRFHAPEAVAVKLLPGGRRGATGSNSLILVADTGNCRVVRIRGSPGGGEGGATRGRGVGGLRVTDHNRSNGSLSGSTTSSAVAASSMPYAGAVDDFLVLSGGERPTGVAIHADFALVASAGTVRKLSLAVSPVILVTVSLPAFTTPLWAGPSGDEPAIRVHGADVATRRITIDGTGNFALFTASFGPRRGGLGHVDLRSPALQHCDGRRVVAPDAVEDAMRARATAGTERRWGGGSVRGGGEGGVGGLCTGEPDDLFVTYDRFVSFVDPHGVAICGDAIFVSDTHEGDAGKAVVVCIAAAGEGAESRADVGEQLRGLVEDAEDAFDRIANLNLRYGDELMHAKQTTDSAAATAARPTW